MAERVLTEKDVSRNVGYKFGQEGDDGTRRIVIPDEKMRWVSLHHHSTFSYQDGIGLPEEHVIRAATLGQTALALTEHGNVSSHVKLERAAQDLELKPLYGCEIYQGVPGTGRGKTENNPYNFSGRKNHLTVLAMNRKGYQNLLQLVSKAWLDEWFYYNMTVTNEMLAEHSEGLIVLSGCTASILATSMIGGKWIDPTEASYDRAKRVAEKYRDILGDRFYLEVQIFNDLEDVCAINQAYERLSQDTGIPLVATADVHYYRPEQARIRQVLHGIGRSKDFTELGQEWNYDIDSSHPTSDRLIFQKLRRSGLSKGAAKQAILSTEEIAQRCDVTLPKAEPLAFPTEGFETDDSQEIMMQWLRDGWRERGLHTWPKEKREQYKERMLYELDIIQEKEFGDYFLIVSDMVKFAKKEGIPVGPARGSAAASLICWLLRITEVDPLREDIPELIFERFIDRTRKDLPDIDLDFDDDLRDEVNGYMAARYGHDHVSNLGTFTGFKGKNSLDDVARVHRIPQYEVDKLKGLLVERSGADLRADATIEDTIEMFEQAREIIDEYPELMDATELEGNLKNFGIHAAGLVVANEPLHNICAIYTRKGRECISLDKYDAEYLNLLKIDNLGLSTMGLLRIAIEEIGMDLDDLYSLPLDDEDTLDGFHDVDVAGIFQFDGRATRSVCEAVRPTTFREIADINALSRPGPLHSGATAEYIDVKHGRSKPQSLHPIVDEVTEKTYGQIVYQEQILRIVREVGGFDWTASAYIRKIISKKLGEQEFNRQWSNFREGAVERGLDEDDAKTIWNQLITSGAYAFNAAHCVAYGLIAYWSMWIKRHYPQAFYVAALTKYGDKKNAYGMSKRDELLQDTTKHGRHLRVLPPDIKKSGVSWTSDGDHVRAGYSQIYGIGDIMGDRIVEAVGDSPDEFETWDDLRKIKGIGPKTAESIEEFVKSEDPFDLELLSNQIEQVREEIVSGELGMLPEPTHKSSEVPYERGADTEVVWLGTIHHRNLKDLFELHYSRTGEELDPDEVKSPEKNEWVSMVGEDDTDLVNVTVDRWRYEKFKRRVWGLTEGEDLVLVKGVKKGYQARRAIYVHEMWVIDPTG